MATDADRLTGNFNDMERMLQVQSLIILDRMIRNYPEMIKAMLPEVSTENYRYLLQEVEDNNKELFREINASLGGEYERKMANELTARYTVGQHAQHHVYDFFPW